MKRTIQDFAQNSHVRMAMEGNNCRSREGKYAHLHHIHIINQQPKFCGKQKLNYCINFVLNPWETNSVKLKQTHTIAKFWETFHYVSEQVANNHSNSNKGTKNVQVEKLQVAKQGIRNKCWTGYQTRRHELRTDVQATFHIFPIAQLIAAAYYNGMSHIETSAEQIDGMNLRSLMLHL